jgi:hypothetical protein
LPIRGPIVVLDVQQERRKHDSLVVTLPAALARDQNPPEDYCVPNRIPLSRLIVVALS